MTYVPPPPRRPAKRTPALLDLERIATDLGLRKGPEGRWSCPSCGLCSLRFTALGRFKCGSISSRGGHTLVCDISGGKTTLVHCIERGSSWR